MPGTNVAYGTTNRRAMPGTEAACGGISLSACYAMPGSRDSTSVTHVFWTKNGALIGSVNYGPYGRSMGAVFASVGIQGEGSRMVVTNARMPPLLKLAVGGCGEVE
eukprot:3615786-Rhodomonas_salina.1